MFSTSTTACACSMPAAYFQFIWRYSLFFFLLTSMTLFLLLQKEGWLSSIHESPQLDAFRLFKTSAFTTDYVIRASFSCHGENTISLHYQFYLLAYIMQHTPLECHKLLSKLLFFILNSSPTQTAFKINLGRKIVPSASDTIKTQTSKALMKVRIFKHLLHLLENLGKPLPSR